MVSTSTSGEAAHSSPTRLLARVGRRGGAWVVVLAVNVVVLTIAETALPTVMGRTIDDVIDRQPTGYWWSWTALVIGVLILSDVTDELGSTAATARSTSWLRRTTVRHLLGARLGSVERLTPGELATRLVGNTEDAGAVGPDVVNGIASIVLASAGVVALALIDPWLCVTFVAGLPMLTFILYAFAKDSSTLNASYLETQGVIASRLVQALQGARTIAAAGTTETETRRVLAPLEDLHRQGKGVWRAQRRVTAQDTLLVALLEIAVLAVAGIEVGRGRISPGQLFAASQYVVLAATFGSASSSLAGLIRERAAVARVGDLLDLAAVDYGSAALPPGPGRLELRQVTRRIGERVVLDRIDLVIPGGSLVAVVGRSGAGKSQLARVAGRLVDPDEGVVLLDGVPLTDLDRISLREAVGYGFERPVLFGDTVSDTIGFGTHRPPDHEVRTAARQALADDFIRHLPDGYRTPLARAPMSGGEVQRIGLARTFSHASRVMVLDDVAASLDTVTEHEISLALTDALADRTRILVAHRASTAARADLVAWLDDGRLVGLAPHHVLWRDEAYRAVFEATPDGTSSMPIAAGVGEAP